MLIKANALKGYTLDSLDGTIGKVKEFYFDDQHWAIRYLVAETGNWLVDRQVVLSPHALVAVNRESKRIAVHLTKKQIEDSPSPDRDKPVSRQFEMSYLGYYGWPQYWGGPHMWGRYPYIVHERDSRIEPATNEKPWDSHLRSTFEVGAYHIHAADGEMGHVEDFVIDDETWAIRYLVVDTRNWWAANKVLISTQWIERVSWNDSKVFVNLSHDTIKRSPKFTEDTLLARDYEIGLHQHYNRLGYWADVVSAAHHSH